MNSCRLSENPLVVIACLIIHLTFYSFPQPISAAPLQGNIAQMNVLETSVWKNVWTNSSSFTIKGSVVIGAVEKPLVGTVFQKFQIQDATTLKFAVAAKVDKGEIDKQSLRGIVEFSNPLAVYQTNNVRLHFGKISSGDSDPKNVDVFQTMSKMLLEAQLLSSTQKLDLQKAAIETALLTLKRDAKIPFGSDSYLTVEKGALHFKDFSLQQNSGFSGLCNINCIGKAHFVYEQLNADSDRFECKLTTHVQKTIDRLSIVIQDPLASNILCKQAFVSTKSTKESAEFSGEKIGVKLDYLQIDDFANGDNEFSIRTALGTTNFRCFLKGDSWTVDGKISDPTEFALTLDKKNSKVKTNLQFAKSSVKDLKIELSEDGTRGSVLFPKISVEPFKGDVANLLLALSTQQLIPKLLKFHHGDSEFQLDLASNSNLALSESPTISFGQAPSKVPDVLPMYAHADTLSIKHAGQTHQLVDMSGIVRTTKTPAGTWKSTGELRSTSPRNADQGPLAALKQALAAKGFVLEPGEIRIDFDRKVHLTNWKVFVPADAIANLAGKESAIPQSISIPKGVDVWPGTDIFNYRNFRTDNNCVVSDLNSFSLDKTQSDYPSLALQFHPNIDLHILVDYDHVKCHGCWDIPPICCDTETRTQSWYLRVEDTCTLKYLFDFDKSRIATLADTLFSIKHQSCGNKGKVVQASGMNNTWRGVLTGLSESTIAGMFSSQICGRIPKDTINVGLAKTVQERAALSEWKVTDSDFGGTNGTYWFTFSANRQL